MQNNQPRVLFLIPPCALPEEAQPIKHNVAILHFITASSAACKIHPGRARCKSNLAFTIRSQKGFHGQLRGQTANYRNNASWAVHLEQSLPLCKSEAMINLQWHPCVTKVTLQPVLSLAGTPWASGTTGMLVMLTLSWVNLGQSRF